MIRALLSSAALLALAVGGVAQAGVTIVSRTSADTVAPGETLVADFSGSGAPAAGFTYSGTTFYTGSASYAAAPWLDDTQYAYVLGGQSATLSTPYGLKSLSVYIGSVDSYNEIDFSGAAGLVGTVTGDQILPGAAGVQGAGGSERVDFSFSDPVTSVTFKSATNSLEFDNVAVSAVSSAPEPETWALMFVGLGALGAMLRIGRVYRKDDAVTAPTA